MSELQGLKLNCNTVFVLGAGASNPYGFPLGSDLKQSISRLLVENKQKFIDADYNESICQDFQNTLRNGTHKTIDQLLEEHPSLRSIGGFSIAFQILRAEYFSAIDFFPRHHDWYTTLFDLLGLKHGGIWRCDIKFVTFNYDRSLEYFFDNVIKWDTMDIHRPMATDSIKRLPIIHAHGSLGNYPDFPFGDNDGEINSLLQAANNLQIVGDDLEHTKDFQKAKDAIQKANQIIFIGWGYDQRTLDRLFKDAQTNRKTVWGTALIDDSEVKRIKGFFKDKEIEVKSLLFAYANLFMTKFIESNSI